MWDHQPTPSRSSPPASNQASPTSITSEIEKTTYLFFLQSFVYAMRVRPHLTHKARRRNANYPRRVNTCKLVRNQQAQREDTAVFKPENEKQGLYTHRTTELKLSAHTFHLATDHSIFRRKRTRLQMLSRTRELAHLLLREIAFCVMLFCADHLLPRSFSSNIFAHT